VKPGHGGGGAITLIKSLLFWAIVVAVVVYLLRNFGPWRAFRIPLLGGVLHAVRGALAQMWTALRSRFRGYMTTVVERVPGARGVLRAAPSILPRGSLPFRRIGSLPPREQVLYYYLSVVRRAHRRGIDRRGSQTPFEFSADLAPRLTAAEGDMDALTDAFVEARYSRHDVPDVEVNRVRTSWQRVKAALRGVRRRSDGERPMGQSPRPFRSDGIDLDPVDRPSDRIKDRVRETWHREGE
jgi:hypothetical protein